MKNAFEILGATPNDNNERLQELFEEQQLLSDDTTEIETAYFEISNPKKRIVHEIAYFANDSLNDYISLVKNEFESRPTVSEAAEIIVNIGLFFENVADELFEKINDARLISGFSSIDEVDLSSRIENLKNEYVALGATYFDGITEKSLVLIFNAIVKIDEYESFFIDDLIEHYKLKIEDTLQKKEAKCKETFDELERICKNFNNESVSSDYATEKASQFVKELKDWDKIAQPLQVNMQHHGGEDEESSSFVHNIRNRVIEIVNNAQEVIGQLLNSLNQTNPYLYYSISQRQAIQQLPQKLVGSIVIIDVMLMILDGLISVFSELDVATERLKQDKTDLVGIKSSVNQLLNRVDPYGKARRTSSQGNYTTTSKPASTTKDTSYSSPSDSKWTAALVFMFIAIFFVSIVGAIACFNADKIAIGIMLIGTLITALVIVVKWYQKTMQLPSVRIASFVLVGIIIFSMILANVAYPDNSSSSGSGSSYSSTGTSQTYTVTLNKDGGSGGTSSVNVKYGNSMPSATKPSKSGYEFGGYFTSKNGNGTQYYSSTMSSSRTWNKTTNTTLYAYWIEEDNGIVLTSSNFENYFTITSSCSTQNSGYSTTATYSYSIKPKSSFYYNNSKNPSSITVTLGLDISSLSTGYGTPSEYKISLTLYKSSGYKTSGTRSYTISSYETYWRDGVYSASGKIYN